MGNERNEHFTGFARLLIHDLATVHDEIGYRSAEDSEKLIAQRAYDLVMYVLSTIDPLAFQATLSDDEIMKSIPDLTKWPT